MPDSEQKLVRRCLQGDTEAFSLLYDRNAPGVYRLLVRLTGNPTQAEDLTQETFLAAYRSLGNWRGQGAFSSWLGGIAVRLYRKSFRPRLLEAELLEEDCDMLASGKDPLDTLTQKEAERLLEKAIADLPDTYREVFVLLRVEGLSQRVVAELLELPIGTVQSRLWRAVCMLRNRLQEQEAFGQETGRLAAEGDKQDAMP